MHGCYNLAVVALKVKIEKESSVGSIVLFLLCKGGLMTSAEDMITG